MHSSKVDAVEDGGHGFGHGVGAFHACVSVRWRGCVGVRLASHLVVLQQQAEWSALGHPCLRVVRQPGQGTVPCVAAAARDRVVAAWGERGPGVRVRHDDLRLTPYSPGVSRLRSAVELASDVEGLRLVLESVLGDRYRVRVRDDGAVVGLWRR